MCGILREYVSIFKTGARFIFIETKMYSFRFFKILQLERTLTLKYVEDHVLLVEWDFCRSQSIKGIYICLGVCVCVCILGAIV